MTAFAPDSSKSNAEFYKLGNPQIGTELELNDHLGVIVAIARVAARAAPAFVLTRATSLARPGRALWASLGARSSWPR